jgi:hypothetical protein
MMISMDTPEDIQKILGPNEKVEHYIKEKIYHPKINIDSLVLRTNGSFSATRTH